MNQSLHVEGQCRECRAPVEPDWVVCAECGAHLGPAAPSAPEPPREAALPSFDIGDTVFVPLMGGAKRPITIREADFPPSQAAAVSLEALIAHGGADARPPPEPPSEDSRRPVTVFVPEPGAAAEPPAAEANNHESSTQLPAVMTPPSPEHFPDDPPAATNLPPTLVVEAVERPSSPRIAPEDLAEMERVVDEAVRKAVREMSSAQATPISLTTSATASAQMGSASGRTAAVGSGILLGASILDLIVLNWDKWIRGDAVSSVGWLQQTGIIGVAALAGAGAATAALSRWQRRRARGRARATRARK